ncbi:MAG TPA: elongation factor P maturation arginine rhamnosyltransferase EarP, partial [Thauera sp.]|nr:elongation factor P maturation arginine rhamnosyltransferase EarP [Thauera sp.]
MDVRLLHERPKWEIFCQVVDNFGDIGVCLRIARDLADRDGKRVRLWVDDWTVLGRLCPAAAAADPGRGVEVDGVVFRHWVQPFPDVVPG